MLRINMYIHSSEMININLPNSNVAVIVYNTVNTDYNINKRLIIPCDSKQTNM
jgi:hypothetical protein